MLLSTTKEHLDKHRNDTASDSTQKPSDLTQFGFNHGKPNKVFIQLGFKAVCLCLALFPGDKNLFQPVNVVILDRHLEMPPIRGVVDDAKRYQQREQHIKKTINCAGNVHTAKLLCAEHNQSTDGQPHSPRLKSF
jgi:hypothetical protein